MIDETLSPTWDELLVFGKLLVYGRKEDIKRVMHSIDKVRLILVIRNYQDCHGTTVVRFATGRKDGLLFPRLQ